MDTEIVEVENAGPKPVVLKFAGAVYPIAPGQRVAAPAAAVKRSVGNWDATDDPESNHLPRTRERDRLSTLYGMCGDPFHSDDPYATVAAADEHNGAGKPIAPPRDYNAIETIDGRRKFQHPALPVLNVRTLDGTRIVTIIDDPDGNIATGKIDRKIRRDETAMLKAQVEQMQRNQEAMLAKLATIDPTAAAELATTSNSPSRVDLPSLHGDENASAGATVTVDPAANPDAMDVMNEELGLGQVDVQGADVDDTPAVRPVAKKAAAKKAAARKADA